MAVKNQSEEGKNNDIPKTPKEIRWQQLKIGNEHIEIVHQYTYLDTRLTPTGNFTLILLHFYMPSDFKLQQWGMGECTLSKSLNMG